MNVYPLQTPFDDLDLEDLGLGSISLESVEYILNKSSSPQIRAVPKYEEDSDDYCRIPSIGEWHLMHNKAFKVTESTGPIHSNYVILRLALVVPYTEYKEVDQL